MANSVINNLFPPIVETYQPARVNTDYAEITFSLSPFVNAADVTAVHLIVSDARNNQNVLKQDDNGLNVGSVKHWCIADGVLVINMKNITTVKTRSFSLDGQNKRIILQYNATKDLYAIRLYPELLRGQNDDKAFNVDQYYQVQLRFDSNPEINYKEFLSKRADESTAAESRMRRSQYIIDEQYKKYFSEWSTVTLIKGIYRPTVKTLYGFTNYKDFSNEDPMPSYQKGLIELTGSFGWDTEQDNAIQTTERVESYQIILHSGKVNVATSDPLKKSPILYTQPVYKIGNKNETIYNLKYLFDIEKVVDVGGTYSLEIKMTTNSGFITSEFFPFTVYQELTHLNISWNDKGLPDEDLWVNNEDGYVDVNLTISGLNMPVIVYIKRGCSRDNFTEWQVFSATSHPAPGPNENKIRIRLKDYTVCSMYTYRYSFQYKRIGSIILSEVIRSNMVYPDFYDMLLMRKDRQIAIRYNGTVNSIQPVTNRQKIDTLGGKYPRFVENAILNYKILSISGLISAEGDFNRQFLSEFEGEKNPEDGSFIGKYTYDMDNYNDHHNGKYLIRNDTVADGEFGYNKVMDANWYPRLNHKENISLALKNTEHDLYPYRNWFWEREFREELIKWLNDGEPKLYRSMTEGNLAVILSDLSLTPNATVGRLVYDFSATLYEVGDGNSLEDLNKLGIIDLPELSPIFIDGEEQNNYRVQTRETVGQFWFQNNGNRNTDKRDIINGRRNTDRADKNDHWTVATKVSTLAPLTGKTFNWTHLSIFERLLAQYESRKFSFYIGDVKIKNVSIEFYSKPHLYVHKRQEIAGYKDSKAKRQHVDNSPFRSYAYDLYEDSPVYSDENKILRQKNSSYINQHKKLKLPATSGSKKITPLWLGYLLNLKVEGDTSENQGKSALSNSNYNDSVSSADNLKEIFVNERGYYQIPGKETYLTNLMMNHYIPSEKAVINYIVEYNEIFDSSSADSPINIQSYGTRIGQVAGQFEPNRHLKKEIYQKYYRREDNAVITLSSWEGISLDVTPYTKIYIKYQTDDNYISYIVGRTGIFSLFEDYALDDLYFAGRRMMRVTDPSRIPFLDEWECYYDENLQSRPTTADVINPQVNQIYFINGTKYYIYYRDYNWYEVEINWTNEQNKEFQTCIAKVPVYGMVNYKGQLLRKIYDN